MLIRPFVLWIVSAGLMVLGMGAPSAQDYPNKIIRIVTSAAGGGSDFTSRQIAQRISGPLGQQVIVENRGSGIVLYEFLAKAPPDGYGLVVTGSTFWILPLLQKVPYDVARDFLPVSLVVREVNVVAVHPSVPAKSIAELIALAQAKPAALNYASGSIGGPPHLSAELFKSMAGVNIVHIPHKGIAAAVTALLAGEVQLLISDAGDLMPHIKSGRVRGLAVTSATPSGLVPGLPTVAASGLPGYESIAMTGIFAPAKTPAAIVTRLNQEVVRFLNRADVKERFLNAGSEIVANSPEQFGATITAEIAKWSRVIKDAGIKVD